MKTSGSVTAPRHPSRRRLLAPGFWLLVPVLLFLLLLTTHPGRVGVKSVLLLPEIFSDFPVRPLTWITPAPHRESFSFDYSVGQVEGDLYVPGWGGRHGALILMLGARPLDRDAPILVRFAEGLSRAGAVVMIPASSNLAAGRVLPEEVDAIVKDVALLQSRDDVHASRIGIVGFSVGGSLAVLAAADPRLSGQLAFVNTFGGYNDARDLLHAVATRSLEYAGVQEPWEPHELTIKVIAQQIADTLPEETDRELLQQIFVEREPAAREEVERLSPLGQAVTAMLDGVQPDDTQHTMQLLPQATHERLASISPVFILHDVRTRLFVMHDLADSFVPYTESRSLVEGAPEGTVELFTEFELFTHVVPDRPPMSPSLIVELAKLYRQLFGMLLHVL